MSTEATHHLIPCRFCGDVVGVWYDDNPEQVWTCDDWHQEADCRRWFGVTQP